jgi:hypothetical protein
VSQFEKNEICGAKGKYVGREKYTQGIGGEM